MRRSAFSFALLMVAALATAASAQVITPAGIVFTGTDPLEPGIGLDDPTNIINGAGLSEPLLPDGSNISTVTHAGVFDFPNAFVSDDPLGASGDFFASSNTFSVEIDLGGEFLVGEIAVWAYHFGFFNANSASLIELGFSTDGGATIDSTQLIDLPMQGILPDFSALTPDFNASALLPVTPTLADTITIDFLDNFFTPDLNLAGFGGDRVGIAEIAFIAVPEPGSSGLVGLAVAGVVGVRRRRLR